MQLSFAWSLQQCRTTTGEKWKDVCVFNQNDKNDRWESEMKYAYLAGKTTTQLTEPPFHLRFVNLDINSCCCYKMILIRKCYNTLHWNWCQSCTCKFKFKWNFAVSIASNSIWQIQSWKWYFFQCLICHHNYCAFVKSGYQLLNLCFGQLSGAIGVAFCFNHNPWTFFAICWIFVHIWKQASTHVSSSVVRDTSKIYLNLSLLFFYHQLLPLNYFTWKYQFQLFQSSYLRLLYNVDHHINSNGSNRNGIFVF